MANGHGVPGSPANRQPAPSPRRSGRRRACQQPSSRRRLDRPARSTTRPVAPSAARRSPASNGTVATGRQARVVEARRVPADLTLAQVDDAPVIEIGRPDLAGRRPPGVVGRDRWSARRRWSSISSWAMQPDLDRRSGTAREPASQPRRPRYQPSPRLRRDRRSARSQQTGHVVRVGEEPLAVGRPARVRADPRDTGSPLIADVVQPERRHVQPCAVRSIADTSNSRRSNEATATGLSRPGSSGSVMASAEPVLGPQQTRLDSERLRSSPTSPSDPDTRTRM